MVADPHILEYPMTPYQFEDKVRNDIRNKLIERKYPEDELRAICLAFDTAAEIHRRKDERRKVPKPFWSGSAGGEPYISHIGRVLNFMLVEPAFSPQAPLGYRLLSSACLHDTLESLTENEPEQFPTRKFALDFVMGKYYNKLDDAGLTNYLHPSEDVKEVIYGLSREQHDVYYLSIGQIFSLSPSNTKRALIIKGFDRIDNSIDLQDLSKYQGYWQKESVQWPFVMRDLKKTLKSYFKTLFVANEIKRYIIQNNPSGDELSFNIRQMPRVIAENMHYVYDIISDKLNDYCGTLPSPKGDKLISEIEQTKIEMIEYFNRGNADSVSDEGENDSELDGTIKKYDRILRRTNGKDTYDPSPREIYRDARAIQTLLYWLSLESKPDFYVHGFEWESFYKNVR